jgi:hypothetical protein
MKFQYRQYLVNPSPTALAGVIHRPVIPISVIGAVGRFPTWALVDPGSDDTLMPFSAGALVGATMHPTQTWHAQGIGGQTVPIHLGEVIFELSDGSEIYRWSTKIGFVDFADPKDEVSLLGQAGFLDFFRVTFDGHQRWLQIETTAAFPGQVL